MLYQRLPERIVNQHSTPHPSAQAQQAGSRQDSRSQRHDNKGHIDEHEFLGMTSAESLSWETRQSPRHTGRPIGELNQCFALVHITVAYNRLRLDFAHEAEDIIELLQTYFSWQYGGHCVIYKPCFFRESDGRYVAIPFKAQPCALTGDMALEGTNFNYFLLNTVCANVSPLKRCFVVIMA